MAKFYNISIFAALFLFTFTTSFEIALSLSPTPSPQHKNPTSQHISHLTPTNALENPHSPYSIPTVEIVYPLSKVKISPKPSPNKPLPSHLAPKSSTITTHQRRSNWGQLAPKSSIKQNLSPKLVEKHTFNSILAPHSHVFSSKPIPHSTTKVTKTSPPKSKLAPRPTPRKYFPTHLAPGIPINKQNLSPKPIEKHTSKSILAPHSHVLSSKPIPHSTTKVTKTSPSKSKLAPRPTPRKYVPTHLAPKIPISKQNLSPKPSPKPTRNQGSKFFLVKSKVGSHVTTRQAKKQHIISPQLAPITYKHKVNPKLSPQSTRKFSLNTQLAPKSTVTKPNSLLSPTRHIITKSRLAPKEAPKLTHKLTPKHGTH
ncbi:uncharacterized protein LOC132620173 [Lycium barbarum]|uniref:uncharacterized protein LOC132620173 n=1 Tax=Lycium barbarum TaxID=112863 RepID=UPI00293E7C58|nr:uncharacterized protein LOC132620173 [Lycium barbarum]